MRRELTVTWLKQGLADLARINAWSRTQADAVVDYVHWMAKGGWRALGYRIDGRQRWRLVPRTTLAIVYWVRGDELRVVRVRQVRRMRRLPERAASTWRRQP